MDEGRGEPVCSNLNFLFSRLVPSFPYLSQRELPSGIWAAQAWSYSLAQISLD
jgi:hypothetical protein